MFILFRPIVAFLLVTSFPSGCAQPNRQNSAVSQLREVEQQPNKKASESAKHYAECVMLSTLVYQSSTAPPSDIADAIQSKCQDKLDAYEMWMVTYYSATIERGRIQAQSERAHRSKEELRLRVRQQAIANIIDDRMKKERTH
jgi:hypothetical protein